MFATLKGISYLSRDRNLLRDSFWLINVVIKNISDANGKDNGQVQAFNRKAYVN